jgi:PadR family transcriptional regulator, regulatory protein AphA
LRYLYVHTGMNLRFALLAVLSAGPRTGYDLVRAFDRTVAFVWHAPHSQIYPELRRMEADGVVAAEELPRGPRGTKREYRITEDGLRELARLADELVEPDRERDPVRLRAAYLEFAEPQAARAQLEAHAAHYTRWLAIWEDMIAAVRRRDEPMLAQRLAGAPPERHDVIVAAKVFAYEGLVARARMEIDWATRGFAFVDEHAEQLRAPDVTHD